MSKNDSRRLVCTACKHENEIERVYCHNCGEKLDRSLLPQIDESKVAEDKAKSGRQMKKMMNPSRFAWIRNLKTFVLIILFAAIVAAVFLAVQPPDNVPPMKAELIPQKMVGEEWAGMMAARVSTSEAFTVSDINAHLRRTVKGAEGALGTKFERAFARFEPGLVTVSTQRNAWGLMIYNSVSFKPVVADGKWSADVSRVSIGRLMIPASIAKPTKLDALVLGALSKVFEKEIKQLDRVATIEVGENVISFATKPGQ